MKNDKFLISIVIGIVVLAVVSIVVVLTRGQQEDYLAGDTPAGVAHNYFLAIQRQEYEKAYSYLSDDLKSKPDLDEFIRTVDERRSESSLKLGESNITGNRARVEVSITTYYGGGPFDSGSHTDPNTAYLRRTASGDWKLIGYPHPYWGWDWDEAKD